MQFSDCGIVRIEHTWSVDVLVPAAEQPAVDLIPKPSAIRCLASVSGPLLQIERHRLHRQQRGRHQHILSKVPCIALQDKICQICQHYHKGNSTYILYHAKYGLKENLLFQFSHNIAVLPLMILYNRSIEQPNITRSLYCNHYNAPCYIFN